MRSLGPVTAPLVALALPVLIFLNISILAPCCPESHLQFLPNRISLLPQPIRCSLYALALLFVCLSVCPRKRGQYPPPLPGLPQILHSESVALWTCTFSRRLGSWLRGKGTWHPGTEGGDSVGSRGFGSRKLEERRACPGGSGDFMKDAPGWPRARQVNPIPVILRLGQACAISAPSLDPNWPKLIKSALWSVRVPACSRESRWRFIL